MDHGSWKYYVARVVRKLCFLLRTMVITIINDTCIENGVPRCTTLIRLRLLYPVVIVLPME